MQFLHERVKRFKDNTFMIVLFLCCTQHHLRCSWRQTPLALLLLRSPTAMATPRATTMASSRATLVEDDEHSEEEEGGGEDEERDKEKDDEVDGGEENAIKEVKQPMKATW